MVSKEVSERNIHYYKEKVFDTNSSLICIYIRKDLKTSARLISTGALKSNISNRLLDPINIGDRGHISLVLATL